MNQSEDFLSIAEKELRFIRDLIAQIEADVLEPDGLDRAGAVALLAEVAADRRRLIERLEPYAPDGGAAWTGAPI
ncbi:hypothetical protein GGC65_001294 [Sphingopyxis sp. OAS728]|uniref:hypothetical protein n=1 Tax=Sphingopyxis sp. OAS728 TaxID=2663823 RepID=UPI001789765B|nr:hypothetical protein [Sphingopyxis sp. OAS728]MBE1526838.1 hypothetical protein [Sphingopyxis sp. OAS728]